MVSGLDELVAEMVAVSEDEQRWRAYDADVARLTELGPNWDSYGGRPVSTAAIEMAREVGRVFRGAGYGPPHLAPLPDGGVRLEWPGITVEAEA